MRGDPRSAGPRGGTESQPLRQDATRSFTRGELLHPDSEGPHVPVASQSPHQLLPCHRPFTLTFLPFLTCAFLLREGKSPGSVCTLHFLQARKLRTAGQRRPSGPTSPAPCWRVAGPVAGDPHCRPILSTSSSLSLLIFDPGHVLHFIMHLS